MSGVELGLAIFGTLDLCLRYVKLPQQTSLP